MSCYWHSWNKHLNYNLSAKCHLNYVTIEQLKAGLYDFDKYSCFMYVSSTLHIHETLFYFGALFCSNKKTGFASSKQKQEYPNPPKNNTITTTEKYFKNILKDFSLFGFWKCSSEIVSYTDILFVGGESCSKCSCFPKMEQWINHSIQCRWLRKTVVYRVFSTFDCTQFSDSDSVQYRFQENNHNYS